MGSVPLYDVFICHASEDKDLFVRPLAERLRKERLEVWYDEFSLVPGRSLRRSIDNGLSRSRYGIVVLSNHFFEKQWPEWELDGLVQRHLSGPEPVILPVWLEVSHRHVLQYSPSLADIVAIQASRGVDHVVAELLRVLRPQGSTLIAARDLLIAYGHHPPVVTDDWWLDVVEKSGVGDVEGTFQEAMGWGRWGFPLPEHTKSPHERGKRVAWTVMQMHWQAKAAELPITQLTHPSEVLNFIESEPGLAEIGEEHPGYVAAYAPFVTLKGMGGRFEKRYDQWLRAETRDAARRQKAGDRCGIALTVDGTVPACNELLALRHKDFGRYQASLIACHFVQGDATAFGPDVEFYPKLEYIAWFLSAKSGWVPRRVHSYLLEGLRRWAVWPWWRGQDDFPRYDGEGDLAEWLTREGSADKPLSESAKRDLHQRLEIASERLALPESSALLATRFIDNGFVKAWYEEQKESRARMAKNVEMQPKESVAKT